ncbi:hypothetical protein AAVH_31675 [Aphelenchoides avenae]|nr:hypothetical protein AAVH_31675 [Aphelenchus avenae]
MFHVGVALVALLVPSVLPCGEKVGNLRAAILPRDPDIGRGHIHVVVFGKVYCAPISGRTPVKVTLEVGDRLVNPSDYKLLSNATFDAGLPFADEVEFALSGDYSYDMFVFCPPAQPRVTVEDFCGKTVLDDIKPVYERELGSKKRLLKVYDLGQIGQPQPGPPYGK